MKHIITPLLIVTFVSLGGFAMFACATKSPRGFRLPDGDVQAGKATFVALGCNQCHKVSGEDLPDPQVKPAVPKLGGPSTTLPTDGQLVTSIINPSHRIKKRDGTESTIEDGKTSRMSDFTEVMTVRQLIDLVAYLHTVHELETLETQTVF